MTTHDSAPATEGLYNKERDIRVAIVRTLWNGHITSKLLEGALGVLERASVGRDDIEVLEVPGAVELTYAASSLIQTGLFDVVIVLGCVIRGGTPHFEYVCRSVTDGITTLNASYDVPVIFGVLTVDREVDALDRAGGSLGNKGAEAAEAALMMYDFNKKVDFI